MTDRTKKNIIELTRIGIDDYHHRGKIPVRMVLDNVRSLNNVGSVLRTCDAFLIDRLLLCGITGTPPNPEIHKTALGAEDSVKWSYHADTLDAVRELQKQGWKVCALEQTHNSVSLNDFTPCCNERYAIVAGNEIHGVDQGVIDAADVVLEIPQQGTKHSLNVSVSTALALWEFFKAMRPRNNL